MSGNFVEHTLKPIFDGNSKILILGTMPSPKSRQNNFYYGNPQNRFWRVMSDILNEPLPQNNQQRKELMLSHGIALWDVLKSCTIDGADDSTIKNPVPNDLNSVISQTQIKTVFTTGKKAYSLYNRFCRQSTGIDAISLPSTSPANCRHYTYEDILREYSVLLAYI
ncbi:MAG: DNA-deoxyinosine glycosylase [Acutalibacteraceae bacterium]